MLDRFCIAFAIAFTELVEIFAVVIAGIVMVFFGLASMFYIFVTLLEHRADHALYLAVCFVVCALAKMATTYLTSQDSVFDRLKSDLRAARQDLDIISPTALRRRA